MVQTDTLTALFHDLVQEAMEQQHIASSETTECYLVHLLERFAPEQQAEHLGALLAERLGTAPPAPPSVEAARARVT